MSRHDFAPEEFAARLARLRGVMAEAGLDWLLLTHPTSIRWLVGQDGKGFQGFQCLPVAAGDGPLVVFAREMDRAEYEADSMVAGVRGYNGGEPEDPMTAFAAFARDLGLANARVGLEVPAYYLRPQHYLALRALLGDALVAEPTGMVPALSQVKSPAELVHVRRAAEIAEAAWRRLRAHVADGVSETALAAEVYHAVLSAGGGLPASTINLATGPRTAFPLGGPTGRRQRPGEAGSVEIGAAAARYTSTLGRQWVLGEPSRRLEALHGVILAASDACMAEMRAGVESVAPHRASRRVIAEAGLEDYCQHTTGYGLAAAFPPAWGEPVNMFTGDGHVLAAGMVMTVEPAVFLPDEGLGVRLIDNCIVTETGVERISTSSRALAVVG